MLILWKGAYKTNRPQGPLRSWSATGFTQECSCFHNSFEIHSMSWNSTAADSCGPFFYWCFHSKLFTISRLFCSFLIMQLTWLTKVKLTSGNSAACLYQSNYGLRSKLKYNIYVTFAGYFLYDFIDIAANKQLSKLWAVIPHHLAVSTAAYILNYCCWMLTMSLIYI